MTEYQAHLEQGRSQLQMYKSLARREAGYAPEAHALHFLQMAAENIAKAVKLRSNPQWDKYGHTGFALIPQYLKGRHHAHKLGWTDFDAYRRFVKKIIPLCKEIERLHPQVGATEGPNVEYPWRGRNEDGQITWHVPAAYDFGLLERMRHGLGFRLIRFLDILIDRFEIL